MARPTKKNNYGLVKTFICTSVDDSTPLDILDGPIGDVARRLLEMEKGCEPDVITLHIDIGYDGGTVEFLKGRVETDEEFEERVQRQGEYLKNLKDTRKEWEKQKKVGELKEYERLKKKYG